MPVTIKAAHLKYKNEQGEYVGVNAISDEDAIAEIDSWLDRHPEATTTVVDGSITYNKLSSDVSGDISDLDSTVSSMTTATASDAGKALKAKTVSGGKVTAWEFGETAIIDNTLTHVGEAADAKVTGDAIAAKVNKPTTSPDGTSGQLLRTNGDGTTQWVDQGLPTDEQTADAVSDWLDNHPEATTTVQNGSITYAKLHSEVSEDITGVKNAITEVEDDVDELSAKVVGGAETKSESISVQLNADGFINANPSESQYGEIYNLSGRGLHWQYSDFVQCEKYNNIEISIIKTVQQSDVGIVFYSDNASSNIPNNIIDAHVFPGGASEMDSEVEEYNIPTGAKYFRTSFDDRFQMSCVGYYEEETDGLIDSVGDKYDLETEDKTNLVSAINELNSKISGSTIEVSENVEVSFYQNGFINANSSKQFYGKKYDVSGYNYIYSDFVNIEKYKYIDIAMIKFTSSAGDVGIVFYTDNSTGNIPSNCVEGISCNAGASTITSETRRIIIPVGAKYFRTSYKDNIESFTCKGYYDAQVGSIDEISAQVIELETEVSEITTLVNNQWKHKTWYAYGTSITNTSQEGKYPTYLAQMSGMLLTNKGISGGGIGNIGGHSRGQVYNAICNITDGKLNADLITLETGANDCASGVPLGTIYDSGQTTLAGCLNDCIRYLQKNTNAQICIINSPATTTEPNATNQYYEWAEMVRKICDVNRVHFLNNNNNMGYAKLSDSTKGSMYIVDNIHQTDLGGFIMAQNLWYQLRNIPLFYTSIPTN